MADNHDELLDKYTHTDRRYYTYKIVGLDGSITSCAGLYTAAEWREAVEEFVNDGIEPFGVEHD